MIGNRENNVWIFNTGNVFNGNPKWLYIYIYNHRKDIKAYWICNDKNTVQFIRNLGFKAYTYKSDKGKRLQEIAGVFVVNQVKEVMPEKLLNSNIKILNLWHGVGCKSIERKLNSGILQERVAKKYIKYNSLYTNNQLFLVTSPLMEKHFKEQCGIDDDKVIRAGYPCCIRNDSIETFEHDLLKIKGLPSNTKIAIYAPTFRENSIMDFFGESIPDIERLIDKLKKNNILLIFKMHPLMEKDYKYNTIKEQYENNKNLMFWDNNNDIYEIFNKIDLAIVDYSSIFYDMLAAGVPNFIRYIFDYENKNNVRDLVFDYKEMTFGTICEDFDSLLETLDDYKIDNENERKRVYNLFWSYTNKNSMEHIINKTLSFKPIEKELPTLYSFDIFDTLIKRKTLLPVGIFYYVKDKISQSNMGFSTYFIENFVKIRRECEANVREYYRKTVTVRNSNNIEIEFDEIYRRMADVYNLSLDQINFMKECELEAEYNNCIPKNDMIEKVKKLIDEDSEVILISDMYLSKDFIKKILYKCDPILDTLPLYLSSEYGVQKANKLLYLKVYEGIEYKYKEWVHYGDNKISDGRKARELGIISNIHNITKFNDYESTIVNRINNYDSYLVATMMSNIREKEISEKEYYAYSYASLYLVPYISWAIKDALRRDIKCLYFISRDGYHLKRIADVIIEKKHLDIKTKYIYGSRKAWRIPSFINEIDGEFFGSFGNFTGVESFRQILDALNMNENDFDNIFSEFKNIDKSKKLDKGIIKSIVLSAKYSEKYKIYLLEKAKEERSIVDEYLNQEINFNEKFAFVEYWGRGYTQDCLKRILHNIVGEEFDVIFYYVRSIYPSKDFSIRYNYTTDTNSLIFVEAVFANLPYRSIREYRKLNGRVEPVLNKFNNNEEFHNALEEYLIRFCDDFYSTDYIDEDSIERELFRFALEYHNKSKKGMKYIAKNIGSLMYSETLYGEEREFAPPITFKVILDRLKGENFKPKTQSISMSLARTNEKYLKLYNLKKTKLNKNKTYIKISKNIKKISKKFLKK